MQVKHRKQFSSTWCLISMGGTFRQEKINRTWKEKYLCKIQTGPLSQKNAQLQVFDCMLKIRSCTKGKELEGKCKNLGEERGKRR